MNTPRPSSHYITPLRTAVLSLLCSVLLAPATAVAAYYNTYTTVATLGNPNGCYATQGFDTGSSYTYSVFPAQWDPKLGIHVT